MEVYVRASDDRLALANESFVAVSNNVLFTGVNGRYIEVRLALVRDHASKWPVLYDLTLYGLSTSFLDWFLDDEIVVKTQDAVFEPWVMAPEPFTYQWYAFYPWVRDWMLLPGQTNAAFVLTNVDSWDAWDAWDENEPGTRFGVIVTSATGERVFVGPAKLTVIPQAICIPSSGVASRYPATIEVFGQSTNFSSVQIILYNLYHDRPEDLDVLLVSPAGTNIMLLSDAIGTNAVANITVVFTIWGVLPPEGPSGSVSSGGTVYYRPSNYGEQENLPSPAPPMPYSTNLTDLIGLNPNSQWKLYIHDDKAGRGGYLLKSWRLKFPEN